MGTQFMPSPAFYGQSQPQFSSYPSGKNGGFSFSKRVERVDWRKVAAIDVDTIARTLDFTTLQENIMNITFCNLEAELDIRSIDRNFTKLFKLAQLTIEYLLHSQEYLAGLCTSLEEKSKQSDQEVESVKKELETLKKELDETKKESHKRKKLLIAQQQLMYAGNESYNKCPFCAKAFLNNSYLQSHITRRHTGGKQDGSSALSPDLGVGSDNTSANHMDAELSHIKERLLKQEAELQEERRALMSLKNKQLNGKTTASDLGQREEGENNGEDVSSAIMKELKELNAKYQASQGALRELEARTGGKRSNLGDLEDDVENEKEMLKEQRGEVAALKEQLQQQLDQMSSHMQTKLEKQDRKWQKKVHQMTQQHVSEIKKLSSVLETTSRSLESSGVPQHHQQKQEVEEVLRSEVQSLKSGRKSRSPKATSHRDEVQQITHTQQQAIRHSSMYPSDDDESTAFGTGTSSLRTIDRNTGGPSTLGQTGTQSLHASQFLEELRKNPTLAVMREELAALLQEHVEKKGIAANQTGISDQVLKNKLSMLETQRQSHVQKYLNFMQLRDHFNKVATEKARKQLRQQGFSPRGIPPPAEMSPHTPRQHHGGPPHPQQHVTRGNQQQPQPHSSRTTTPRGSTPRSPHPKPQPRMGGTGQGNRPKTPLSTGSTTEWTSTQFDSDEEEEDSEEDDDYDGPGHAFVPTPGARLIQSGPARGAPQPRVIQSRPVNNNAVEDIDDLLESEGEDKAGSPNRVSALRNTIEGQLGARRPGAKPFGGVDVGGRKAPQQASYDEESDWDDTTAPNEPPASLARKRGVQASTDGMSTNTYGTSAWGGSSKAASTVKDKERRSTSRSSFASVTSVSSDESMNVDNL